MNKLISPISDKDKLTTLLETVGMNRSELARALQVNYKAVYRWIDLGVKPHARQSQEIDELFKQHVDLRPLVLKVCKGIKDPIGLLKNNAVVRNDFFLQMTY